MCIIGHCQSQGTGLDVALILSSEEHCSNNILNYVDFIHAFMHHETLKALWCNGKWKSVSETEKNSVGSEPKVQTSQESFPFENKNKTKLNTLSILTTHNKLCEKKIQEQKLLFKT